MQGTRVNKLILQRHMKPFVTIKKKVDNDGILLGMLGLEKMTFISVK